MTIPVCNHILNIHLFLFKIISRAYKLKTAKMDKKQSNLSNDRHRSQEKDSHLLSSYSSDIPMGLKSLPQRKKVQLIK